MNSAADPASSRHAAARTELKYRIGAHLRAYLAQHGFLEHVEQTRLIEDALDDLVRKPQLNGLQLNGTTEQALNAVEHMFHCILDELAVSRKPKRGIGKIIDAAARAAKVLWRLTGT